MGRDHEGREEVKLIDFGIARVDEPMDGKLLTSAKVTKARAALAATWSGKPSTRPRRVSRRSPPSSTCSVSRGLQNRSGRFCDSIPRHVWLTPTIDLVPTEPSRSSTSSGRRSASGFLRPERRLVHGMPWSGGPTSSRAAQVKMRRLEEPGSHSRSAHAIDLCGVLPIEEPVSSVGRQGSVPSRQTLSFGVWGTELACSTPYRPMRNCGLEERRYGLCATVVVSSRCRGAPRSKCATRRSSPRCTSTRLEAPPKVRCVVGNCGFVFLRQAGVAVADVLISPSMTVFPWSDAGLPLRFPWGSVT